MSDVQYDCGVGKPGYLWDEDLGRFPAEEVRDVMEEAVNRTYESTHRPDSEELNTALREIESWNGSGNLCVRFGGYVHEAGEVRSDG